jgi:hypothetical protein
VFALHTLHLITLGNFKLFRLFVTVKDNSTGCCSQEASTAFKLWAFHELSFELRFRSCYSKRKNGTIAPNILSVPRGNPCDQCSRCLICPIDRREYSAEAWPPNCYAGIHLSRHRWDHDKRYLRPNTRICDEFRERYPIYSASRNHPFHQLSPCCSK